MHRYQIRRRLAAATSMTVPGIVGLTALLLVRPVALGLLAGLVFFVAVSTPTYLRVRRRTLTVTDIGIQVQRDRYRLTAPWRAVTGVQHRRHQGVMSVDELLVTDASLEPVDSRGRSSTLPRGVSEHPARTRIMVSLYDKQWRRGPVAEHLRRAGISLN